MTESTRHTWVVGRSRAARAASDPMRHADVAVDCHRNHRGPYSGVGEMLRRVVPAVLRDDPRLVQRHDIEILSLAPELRGHVAFSRETLTSLAVPRERTRFYSANRTRRLAHGIVEFLDAHLRAGGSGSFVVAFDTVHEADRSEQELLAILLRRADPHVLRVVVGTDGDELPDELTEALADYAVRVDLPDAPAEPDGRTEDELALAYVASDGTSDVAAELAAYERLDPAARAALHDARADELSARPDFGLRLGAIPYHREHGSDPVVAGGHALYDAVNYCLDMGFYPAVVELGLRSRAVLDPDVDSSTYFQVSTKVTTALAAMLRADEAEEIYVELRSRYTSTAVHMASSYALGMIYTRHRDPSRRNHRLALGHLNNAIALADHLADEDRPFHQAFHRNGRALAEVHMGNLEKALELVDWGIARLDEELGPDRHRLHRSVLVHNRAQVLMALGRLTEALADLDRVIEVDPHYAEYHFDRANLLRRLGDHDGAMGEYDKAISLTPPFYELHYNRADLRAATGDVAGAIAEFGYVLELEPDHLDARVNRASLALDAGDHETAARDVEVGLRFHPDDPHLLCSQGLLRLEAGDPVGARASFTAALATDPTMHAALSNRAVLAYEAGDAQAAIDDLTVALDAHGDDADLLYNRGFVFEATGQPETAADDYTRALALAPDPADRAELLHRRARCHAAAGRTELAATDLHACLALGGGEDPEGVAVFLEKVAAA